MPEIDKVLKTELQGAKRGPRNFIFVAGKQKVLVLGRGKIGTNVIQEAKEKAGSSTLFSGRCFGEEGLLVFEIVAKPPGTLQNQLMQGIKYATGLSMKVEVRQVEKLEPVGNEEMAPPESSSPGPSGKSTAPPSTESPEKAEFTARLKELQPDVTKAKTTEEGKKANLDQLVNQALSFAKETKYAKGLQILDMIEDRLDKLEDATSDEDLAQEAAKEQLKDRLADLTTDYLAVRDTTAGKTKNLPALMAKVLALSKSGKHEEGLAALDELEALIESAKRAQQVATEIEEQAGENVVVFTQARLAWDQARKTVQEQAGQLKAAILGDPETQEDPRFEKVIRPKVEKLVEKISGLKTFDQRLLKTLDGAKTAKAAPEREKYRGMALLVIKEYLSEIEANPLLQVVDDSGYGSYDIYSTLVGTLEDLADQLAP